MTVAQMGAVVGLVLILIVFYDLLQTVVLPRPAVNKVQLARRLVRPMWLIWRWVSRRTSRIAWFRSRSGLAIVRTYPIGPKGIAHPAPQGGRRRID